MAVTTLIGQTNKATGGVPATDTVTLPGGLAGTDLVVLIIFRTGITINGGATMGSAGWANELNFGGPQNLQFNVFRGLRSALPASDTVTYTQSGAGISGLWVCLGYRFAQNAAMNPDASTGGAATQPAAGAPGAGLGTRDVLVLLGVRDAGTPTILPSAGALYGYDFNSPGNRVAYARISYNNAGGNPSFTGTPNPAAEWSFGVFGLLQTAGAPASVAPFLGNSFLRRTLGALGRIGAGLGSGLGRRHV